MSPTVRAYIGLGSNLEDLAHQLRSAIDALHREYDALLALSMRSMIGALESGLSLLEIAPQWLGDASLREAYAKHRRFVACSMTLLFGVGMNAVAVAVASCLAWVPSTNPLRLTLLVVCGAGGGTLVGLGGAAIGTVSSLRRVRIAAQLRGLEAARSSPTH